MLLYIYTIIYKIIHNTFMQQKKDFRRSLFFVCKGIRICNLILHGRNRKDHYRFGL